MTIEQFEQAEPLIKGIKTLKKEIAKAKANVKVLSEIKDRALEIPMSNIFTDEKDKLMVNVCDLQSFYFDQQVIREYQLTGLENEFNKL